MSEYLEDTPLPPGWPSIKEQQEYWERKEEFDTMKAMAVLLFETLRDAAEHLNYCGYGDKWERECAKEGKLQERIESALQEYVDNYL